MTSTLYAEEPVPAAEVVDPASPVTIVEETPLVEAPAAEVTEDLSFEPPSETVDVPEATPEGDPVATPAPEVAKEPVPEAKAPPVEKVAEPEAPAPTTPVPVASPDSAPMSMAIVEDPEDYQPRKSHWQATFGFESMAYDIPREFVGTKASFDDDDRTLFGGRLGFAREFYLGWGFNTTSRIEGFYMGTLFEKATTAAPQETTEEFAFEKKTGSVFGADVSQSLGFLYNFSTKNPLMDEMVYLTLEPFVFAGVGRARAYNRFSYHYDTGVFMEDYRIRVQDSITSTSFGGGFNLTSVTGFFLYLKATQYSMNITKRNETGYSQPHGQGATPLNRTSTDVSPDPITIYALGGGYKF